jgi:hypothetical protein
VTVDVAVLILVCEWIGDAPQNHYWELRPLGLDFRAEFSAAPLKAGMTRSLVEADVLSGPRVFRAASYIEIRDGFLPRPSSSPLFRLVPRGCEQAQNQCHFRTQRTSRTRKSCDSYRATTDVLFRLPSLCLILDAAFCRAQLAILPPRRMPELKRELLKGR